MAIANNLKEGSHGSNSQSQIKSVSAKVNSLLGAERFPTRPKTTGT